MGFLDHSTNNIILDAVLTDAGREALARNDGSFEIFKFAFSDEEVDYSHIVHFGRTVGKEKIEKNTPVLEAVTQGNLGQKYRCRSINNDSLTRLPTLSLVQTLTDNILSLGRNSSSGFTTNSFVQAKQSLASGILDPDLIDFSFRVTCDYLFLGISNRVPDSIDNNNVAVYTIAASPTIDAQNLSTLGMTLYARDVSTDLFTTYQQKGSSIVEKVVTVSGVNSGATLTFRVQIS
jgi:hypothetical protein|tara:strand:+ start:1944 stop:2645 length:702 start_codon:yes stop_codon:yes gene_type:complete